jgi:hypothetical protein
MAVGYTITYSTEVVTLTRHPVTHRTSAVTVRTTANLADGKFTLETPEELVLLQRVKASGRFESDALSGSPMYTVRAGTLKGGSEDAKGSQMSKLLSSGTRVSQFLVFAAGARSNEV